MSEKGEDIELVLEDDKPGVAAADGAAAAGDGGTQVITDPEVGIETLKEQLAAEKTAREIEAAARQRAETEAARHAEAAAKAKGEVAESQVELVENAIGQLKEREQSLETRYADAMTAGDYGEAAKVQTEIAKNASKLLTLENGLEQMKAAPKPRPAETGGGGDAVEALAGQLTARSAAWVRSHPECATNPRLYQRMIAAHNLAITDGLKPDTDDYFKAVDQTMGFASGPATSESDDAGSDALSAAARPAQRRSAPPAAPVGRGGGDSPTRVTLTADEREIAQMNGLTEQEYARNKLALQKEGRLH